MLLALWMLVRSISDHLFRTGSLLLGSIIGDKLDIEYWALHPDSAYRRAVAGLAVAQNVFTLAIGLFILCVYLQLGLSKLQQCDPEPGHESATRGSSLNGTAMRSQLKSASTSYDAGTGGYIALQRSLLI